MSFSYFNKLNYTLANEDTSMELGIFKSGLGHLMSVAGSGGRVLPLLSKSPTRVTCVDLSREQLLLTELRFQSTVALEHAEFLAFWGYPPHSAEPAERRRAFQSLQLSADCRELFLQLFESIGWESLLYLGKWERTFGRLSAVNRKIIGERGTGLFSALTCSEHEDYLRDRFPHRSWKLTLALLGNASVFNSLLYKGHFPKMNLPGTAYGFYKSAFDRLFAQGPARRNFFLQMMFFGKVIFAEGNPVECDPEVYAQARKALKSADVRYIQGNIVEIAAAEGAKLPIDALSLSDVPSYFTGATEKLFMQRIRPALAPGSLTVIRSYLHVPEGTDLTGFENVARRYEPAIRAEKTQMYQVDVHEKTS